MFWDEGVRIVKMRGGIKGQPAPAPSRTQDEDARRRALDSGRKTVRVIDSEFRLQHEQDSQGIRILCLPDKTGLASSAFPNGPKEQLFANLACSS